MAEVGHHSIKDVWPVGTICVWKVILFPGFWIKTILMNIWFTNSWNDRQAVSDSLSVDPLIETVTTNLLQVILWIQAKKSDSEGPNGPHHLNQEHLLKLCMKRCQCLKLDLDLTRPPKKLLWCRSLCLSSCINFPLLGTLIPRGIICQIIATRFSKQSIFAPSLWPTPWKANKVTTSSPQNNLEQCLPAHKKLLDPDSSDKNFFYYCHN